MDKELSMDNDVEKKQLAQARRCRRQSEALRDVMLALQSQPFNAKWAAKSWAAFEGEWAREVAGVAPRHGWSMPWDSEDFDCGQCDNEHADDRSHPLIHACRFGSPEAVAWVCRQRGVEPVVKFESVADCWCFARAANSGMPGAFEPMWNLAKRLGWSGERLGLGLAAWLYGASEAPAKRIGEVAMSCAGAMREWEEQNPGALLPMAPLGPFNNGLERAIHSDYGRSKPEGSKAVKELLAAPCANAGRGRFAPVGAPQLRGGGSRVQRPAML